MSAVQRTAELRLLRQEHPADFRYVSELVESLNIKGIKTKSFELPSHWDQEHKERVFAAMKGMGFAVSSNSKFRFKAPTKQLLLGPVQAAIDAIAVSYPDKTKIAAPVPVEFDEENDDDLINAMDSMRITEKKVAPSTPKSTPRKAVKGTPGRVTPQQQTPSTASKTAARNTPGAVRAMNLSGALMSPAQRRVSMLVPDMGTPGKGATKAQAVMIGNGFAVENLDGASSLSVDFDLENNFLLLEFMDDEVTSDREEDQKRRVVLPFESMTLAMKTLGAEMLIKFESGDDVMCYTWSYSWGTWNISEKGESFYERIHEALALEPCLRIQFCRPESMSTRLAKLQQAMASIRLNKETAVSAPALEAHHNADGTTLDFYQKYRLGLPLGSGAFAEVSVATDAETKEKYAVKIMNTRKISSKVLENVLQEFARAKKASGHPNVATMFSMYGSPTEGRLMLVQELCVGGELFDRIIDTEGMCEADSRQVIAQVLHAVAYLHDQGTIHRDLKPENIMFKRKGGLEIRLIDFGIGKSLSSDNDEAKGPKAELKQRLRNRISMQSTHSTSSKPCNHRHMTLEAAQTICGTHEYMAPEVWQAGNACGYGTSCDIWSVGVILFAMLSMAPAFYGDNPAEIREAVLKGRPDFGVWPFAGAKGERLVGPLCVPVIKRMLEVDPKKRPTAKEVLQDAWFKQD